MAETNDEEGEAGKAGEVKDKFRAALERKRGQQADRAADAENRGDSKIHHEHGAAGGKRTFRRKSGCWGRTRRSPRCPWAPGASSAVTAQTARTLAACGPFGPCAV